MTSDPTGTTTAQTQIDVDRDNRLIEVTRTFDAPREAVFKAWTEADRIAKWWAPGDWTTEVRTLDARPGGIFHYCMRGPDGTEAWGIMTYREVVAPERLVGEDAFSDKQGSIVPPVSSWTVEFIDEGGRTRLRNLVEYSTVEDLDKVIAMGMSEGVRMAQDNLAAYLATPESRT
jgi:uncharacterized protein YndB with AHSA1/START domain